MLQQIAVVGAGAWGTALAIAARRAGREVVLWARDAALSRELESSRENRAYLPGAVLPPGIAVTHDIGQLAAADAVLLVPPAQALREVAAGVSAAVAEDRPFVICAKGIERSSLALMTEVLDAVAPGRPRAVLSGPTFATEVAAEKPTAVTLASDDPGLAGALAGALGSGRFRPYRSSDPVGAQIGGAVKNVIAIACGVVAGRTLGENARAALIARGLAEVVRLGLAKGARAGTLMGLSGLGDLTLTCTAMQSRNYSLGVALGAGQGLGEILAERRTVAEGVHSAAAVVRLAARLSVEMPICQAVDGILNQGASVDEVVDRLLSRPLKDEQADPF